jgi:hypothetical protein
MIRFHEQGLCMVRSSSVRVIKRPFMEWSNRRLRALGDSESQTRGVLMLVLIT